MRTSQTFARRRLKRRQYPLFALPPFDHKGAYEVLKVGIVHVGILAFKPQRAGLAAQREVYLPYVFVGRGMMPNFDPVVWCNEFIKNASDDPFEPLAGRPRNAVEVVCESHGGHGILLWSSVQPNDPR